MELYFIGTLQRISTNAIHTNSCLTVATNSLYLINLALLTIEARWHQTSLTTSFRITVTSRCPDSQRETLQLAREQMAWYPAAPFLRSVKIPSFKWSLHRDAQWWWCRISTMLTTITSQEYCLQCLFLKRSKMHFCNSQHVLLPIPISILDRWPSKRRSNLLASSTPKILSSKKTSSCKASKGTASLHSVQINQSSPCQRWLYRQTIQLSNRPIFQLVSSTSLSFLAPKRTPAAK